MVVAADLDVLLHAWKPLPGGFSPIIFVRLRSGNRAPLRSRDVMLPPVNRVCQKLLHIKFEIDDK